MGVPSEDIVCRFIRPGRKRWSKRDNRPRPPVFKERQGEGLSLWHEERLHENAISLDDLRIGSLSGAGQAHHTVGDYFRLACKASDETGRSLSIRLEWRTEPRYVGKEWRQWSYAHVQAEILEGADDVQVHFRNLLALNARRVVPPNDS